MPRYRADQAPRGGFLPHRYGHLSGRPAARLLIVSASLQVAAGVRSAASLATPFPSEVPE
jgi:hypothetical protein